MSRQLVLLCYLCLSSPTFATGLTFWESSPNNTALAAANGAIALDSSVLALAPSSITQLNTKNISVAVASYKVTTDYNMFGEKNQYSKANPIPSFFVSTPLANNFYGGLSIYSRNAADISIPEGGFTFPLFPGIDIPITISKQTRVMPILVSTAPTLAYRFGNFSVASTLEYIHAQYELETKTSLMDGTTNGWSGAFSATWQLDNINFAYKHQLDSNFDDKNVAFALPSQNIFYISLMPTKSWTINTAYSETKWKEKGVFYTDYTDPFGLIKGSKHSRRLAFSTSYQLNNLRFMAGYSEDEAIDTFGGIDKRYRLGIAYKINSNWDISMSWLKERYAHKEAKLEDSTLVSVQNNGKALSLGVNYQFN
ncbi:MAG: hypothetical protein GY920_18035 [Aliivibrio sp.]|nr:hypothetical protein [Aliivibrio sp.]